MTPASADPVLRVLRKLACAPSYERALRVGRSLGVGLGVLSRYRRPDALAALRLAFPETPEPGRRAILRAMYGHFGMNLVDSLRLLDDPPEAIGSRIVWDGLDRLKGELARGRGVLALTAHTGNWEMLCATAPLFGLPLTIVAKPIRGRSLRRHVHAVRTRFGLRVLPAKGSYRDCLRALRRNRLLGFVLDQNMIRREGVFVPFFGRPASTTPGLAHLSARSGARVVPVFTARRPDGRHSVQVFPPMEPPADTRPETLAEATRRYTECLESFIRRHPEQWIWIHRRWKTRPPDEDRPPLPSGAP